MSQQRGSGEGSRTPSSDGWGSELGWASLAHSHRQPFRASSPLSLTHLDMWDKKAPLRAQSSVWSSKEGMPGGGLYYTHKASSPGSDTEVSLRTSQGARRWQSLSRLAPEGAPRSLSPSPGAELRAALMESGARRAELIQRLREAQERLDSQTDLLKARDTQLHHSQTSTQLLELRQKQLADAVSSLEQEKETAELCRFEESRRRGELQDKVLQLELDMLKMRSTLERKACAQHTPPLTLTPLGSATYSSPLSKTLPSTQEDFSKQRRRQMERELREAREALRDAQESLQSLDEEKDQALQELHSAKESQLAVQTQVEEAKQRLNSAMRTQSELQDQLSEARSHLGQTGLERDLLSSKVLRIEDCLEDVKLKLSTAMADKDRLMQEKVELHQRVQSLELQLERAQHGREGYTDQVCELHGELVDTKSHVNRLEQEKVQMKEELVTLKELHKTGSTELGEARQRLEAVLGQLHELEAEKVIHTNQIVALETERSQLIGEKEELVSSQEEVTELRKSCHKLRESQNSLLLENQELQSKCQAQEAGIFGKEAELRQKEAQLQQREEDHAQTEADMAQEVEEQRRVGSHWKERWQETAVALRTAQDQLEDARRQHSAEMSQLRQEAAQLAQELEKVQREAQSSQEQMQAMLQQKADMEAELNRVKKEGGALVKVELDACRQQLDLEKNRSQALLRQLSSSPVREGRRGSLLQESPREREVSDWTGGGVRNPAAETQDRGTETDFFPALEHVQSLQMSSSQQDIVQALSATSLQEVDGELGQMRAELQKVWDMLRERDTELEEHQQELQSARGQVSQQSSEVQRLEQQLTEKEEELEKKEQALRRMERLREAERTETQITVSSLEMKLAELTDLGVTENERKGSPERTRSSGPANSHPDSLQAELEDMRMKNVQLQQERDRVVQTLQQLQQRKTERVLPESKKEIRPENLDHDKQRRLVTEQLKSLFKEREQLGRAYEKSAAAQRGSHSLQDWTGKSKIIKNAMDTLANQKRREHELQQGRNSLPGVTERVVSDGQQGVPDIPELQGMQEQVARLTEELHSKTDKGLRGTEPSGERKARGVPHRVDMPMEGKREPEPFSNIEDGTYVAKQVNVGGSEEEEGDEEEKEVRVAVAGEAGGSSRQDPWPCWDSLPSPACTDTTSTPLLRAISADTLNLPPPSANWSPDLSPRFPHSWAGSQECLPSPRPYRPQSARETQ
ncbi:paramyosin-like isoform X2 [Anguilla anguilla]|uniref:paramyosin-like isoform X2 n=1 Tax=Anguilla anguilla TaxID=7936 RepID=UPI0015B01D87|nr:paramyosin-like isoform X2 [Anguilla anguilla]